VSSARCSCGAAFRTFWIWPDEEQENLIHVTDRARDAPRHAENLQAVSAPDAAVAYDRRHEPEHDVQGQRGLLRKGRCQRRSTLRTR
jgi:hypothetical protein